MNPQIMTPSSGISTPQFKYPEEKTTDWPKWIALLLTLISMCVGVVVWATSEHSDIRSWTADQDFVTKQELKEIMKESYVPLHEFTKVKQQIDDQGKKIEEMSGKIDILIDQVSTLKGKGRR